MTFIRIYEFRLDLQTFRILRDSKTNTKKRDWEQIENLFLTEGNIHALAHSLHEPI